MPSSGHGCPVDNPEHPERKEEDSEAISPSTHDNGALPLVVDYNDIRLLLLWREWLLGWSHLHWWRRVRVRHVGWLGLSIGVWVRLLITLSDRRLTVLGRGVACHWLSNLHWRVWLLWHWVIHGLTGWLAGVRIILVVVRPS